MGILGRSLTLAETIRAQPNQMPACGVGATTPLDRLGTDQSPTEFSLLKSLAAIGPIFLRLETIHLPQKQTELCGGGGTTLQDK